MSTAVVRLHGEVYPPRAVFLADVARLMARFACASADEATARHFGEHLKTGGKRLRARLVAAAGEALNAPLDGITAWAAAVELMHNATLIHDDIQDNDRMRRGQPTTWAKYGVGQAINVGDFGLMLPFMLAAEMNAAPATRASLTGLLARHGVCAAQGQTWRSPCSQTVDSITRPMSAALTHHRRILCPAHRGHSTARRSFGGRGVSWVAVFGGWASCTRSRMTW